MNPTLEAQQKELLAAIDALPKSEGKLDAKIITGADSRAKEDKVVGLIKAHYTGDLLLELQKDPKTAAEKLTKIAQAFHVVDASEQGNVPPVKRVDALPVKDDMKKFLQDVAAAYDPKSGKLDATKVAALTEQAKKLTVERSDLKALLTKDIIDSTSEKKLYQLTTDGRVFNQSTVRTGNVPGAPGDYVDLRKAFNQYSNDNDKKTEAVSTFLKNAEPAKKFMTNDKGEIVALDIGFGDSIVTTGLLKGLNKLTGDAKLVRYVGVEGNPSYTEAAKKAVQEAGLKPEQSTLIIGRFGLPDKPAAGTAPAQLNSLDQLKELGAQKEKIGFVLFSHVYAFDAKAASEQVQAMLKKDGIAFFQHESAESDMVKFRKAHATLLRPSGQDVTASLSDAFKKGEVTEYNFTVKSTVKYPVITKEEWQMMKDIKSGTFVPEYKFPTEEAKKAFEHKRNLVEEMLQAPLGAFTKDDREKILTDLEAYLKDRNYTLTSVSKGQLVGKGKSEELAKTLDAIAKKTEADLREIEKKDAEKEKAPNPARAEESGLIAAVTRAVESLGLRAANSQGDTEANTQPLPAGAPQKIVAGR